MIVSLKITPSLSKIETFYIPLLHKNPLGKTAWGHFHAVFLTTEPDPWPIGGVNRFRKKSSVYSQLKCIRDRWKSNLNSAAFTKQHLPTMHSVTCMFVTWLIRSEKKIYRYVPWQHRIYTNTINNQKGTWQSACTSDKVVPADRGKYKNLAIANTSHVSCAQNTLRASISINITQ